MEEEDLKPGAIVQNFKQKEQIQIEILIEKEILQKKSSEFIPLY